MVKKGLFALAALACFCWSCTTYSPQPPSLYIDQIPASVAAELPLEERLLAEEAWTNLSSGDGEEAEKNLVKLGQQSPLYYAGLGYALYLLDDITRAEEFFKAALVQHPDMVLIHVGIAQIYAETGRRESEFGELRTIMKLDPDHSWAKPKFEATQNELTREALDQARTFERAGDSENGKASYLKALFYSPTSVEAHFTLANLYTGEENYQSALVHLKAANTYAPDNTDILKLYGEVLFTIQDNKKALEIYDKLALEEPDNSQIQERLEVIKSRLGLFELPSQYDFIPTSQAVTREDIAALIAVKLKDVIEEPSEQPPIIVDIATSWAAKFILQITSLNLVEVYPNHEFQPKKVLSRAELSQILVRLVIYLEEQGHKFIQQIPLDRIQIEDVTPANFYYQPILTIISYDIMGLFPDRTFRPDAPVTGAEATKIFDILLVLIG